MRRMNVAWCAALIACVVAMAWKARGAHCKAAHRVTLSDDEAKRRRGQKTVIERMGPPTFDVAVEIIDRHCWRVHPDVAAAVDALLRGVCWHLHSSAAGLPGKAITLGVNHLPPLAMESSTASAGARTLMSLL